MTPDERALLESIVARFDSQNQNIMKRLDEQREIFKQELDRFYTALARHTSMPHCAPDACKIGINLNHHVERSRSLLGRAWQIFLVFLSALLAAVLAVLGVKQ